MADYNFTSRVRFLGSPRCHLCRHGDEPRPFGGEDRDSDREVGQEMIDRGRKKEADERSYR